MREKSNKTAESRSMVSRLMADENISVVFSKDLKTADFNLETRLLRLPIWEDMTDDAYDMLIAHEVSHALHTPEAGWCNFVGNDRKRHATLNVLEDARIERLIKRRYPGVAREMKRGYDHFHSRNFFGLTDTELNTGTVERDRNFLDRINLHFKSYGNLFVRFNDEEQKIVDEIEVTDEWSDLVKVAEKLVDELSNPENEENEGDDESVSDENETDDSDSSDSAGSDSEESDSAGSDSEESDSDDIASGDDLSGSSDDNDDSESEASDSVDSESDDESDSSESSSASDNGDGFGINENNDDPFEVDSMENFEEETSSRTAENEEKNNWGDYADYLVIRDRVLDGIWNDITIPASKFARYIRNYKEYYSEKIEKAFKKQLKNSKKSVNLLVKEFEMRKSADEHKRTMSSKTGSIDLDRIVNYKTSDNIFLSKEVVVEGQSHGLVMMIDLSGSMSGKNLKLSMSQVFNMVLFAKRVGIPFKILGFTNGKIPISVRLNINEHDNLKRKIESLASTRGANELVFYENFHMLTIVDSNMSKSDYRIAMSEIALNISSESTILNGTLGGTPLNEALYVMPYIIRKFKNETNVDRMIVMTLTDGDGMSSRVLSKNGTMSTSPVFSYVPKVSKSFVAYDPHLGKFYRGSEIFAKTRFTPTGYPSHFQNIMNRRITDIPYAKHIGYFVSAPYNYDTMIIDPNKEYSRYHYGQSENGKNIYSTKFAAEQVYDYDDYVFMSNELRVKSSNLKHELRGLTDSESVTKAFATSAESANANRMFARRLMESVA